MVIEFLATIIVSLFLWGAFTALWGLLDITKRERQWLRTGFGVHLVASWIQLFLLVTVYEGGGDMGLYYLNGEWIADWLRSNPDGFREVFRLISGEIANIPFPVFGSGSSTGSMSGVAGLLMLLTQGSKYASNSIAAMFAYVGLVAFYWAFRTIIGPNKWAAMATLFMPSVTFWAGGLQKEAIAVGGMGLTIAGFVALFTRKKNLRTRGLLLLVFGSWVVLTFKPYILVALFTAIAALTIRRMGGRGYIQGIFSLLVAGLALFVVTIGMPEYAPEQVLEQTAQFQTSYSRMGAGSNIEFQSQGEESVQGQLANVPEALLSAFFRPFFFEIKNLMMAFTAIEMTLLTFLAIQVLFRRGIRSTVSEIVNNPVLLFCAVFIVLFGVAVGLAAPNLGTLSRYRVPMMPMYGFLLLSLAAKAKKVKQDRRIELDRIGRHRKEFQAELQRMVL